MDIITVKIGRVPGALREVSLTEGATISSVLEVAEMKVAPYEVIRLNGAGASDNDYVKDGDVIHILKAVEGNG